MIIIFAKRRDDGGLGKSFQFFLGVERAGPFFSFILSVIVGNNNFEKKNEKKK